MLTDKMSLPSLAQLNQPVDGPNQDAQRHKHQAVNEPLKPSGLAQLGVGIVKPDVGAGDAVGKLRAQRNKQNQRDHLPREASNHDVGSHGRVLVVLRHNRGNASSRA